MTLVSVLKTNTSLHNNYSHRLTSYLWAIDWLLEHLSLYCVKHQETTSINSFLLLQSMTTDLVIKKLEWAVGSFFFIFIIATSLHRLAFSDVIQKHAFLKGRFL